MTKHCLFLWKRTYLFFNGDILSCGNPQHPIMGNIADTDFMEIWNGNEYQEMRSVFSKGIIDHPCFDCATTGFLSNSNFFASQVNSSDPMRKDYSVCQGAYSRQKAINRELLEYDISEKRSTLRAYPTFIGLETDTRCNLRCVMCIHRLHDYRQLVNYPPVEESLLIRFAEQTFPTADIVQLNASGEPFMSRHVDLEIELAEYYGARIQVITNGTLINAKKGRLEKLMNNAFSVQVSIDSPDKKKFSSIRPGADLDQVIENLRLLQKMRNNMPTERRPSFSINMVLMKSTLRDLPTMVMFTKDMGADHLEISRIVIHTKEMEIESLAHCKKECNQALLEAKKIARNLNVSIAIPPLFTVTPDSENREMVRPLDPESLERGSN